MFYCVFNQYIYYETYKELQIPYIFYICTFFKLIIDTRLITKYKIQMKYNKNNNTYS